MWYENTTWCKEARISYTKVKPDAYESKRGLFLRKYQNSKKQEWNRINRRYPENDK